MSIVESKHKEMVDTILQNENVKIKLSIKSIPFKREVAIIYISDNKIHLYDDGTWKFE